MVQKPDANTDQPDRTDKDLQDAGRSTADFIQNVAPLQEHKRKSRKRRLILIVLVLIIGIGVGGYFLYTFLQRSPEKEPTQQTSQSEKNEDSEAEDGLKNYSSSALNLSFKYPEGWHVNDEEQNTVKVESPLTKLSDASGQQIDAKIVLSVVPASADMSDFPDDKATGVRDSEKFPYDSPTADQRQETFVSFMNLSGASDGLNAIYITGDNSYVKGDPVTKADFDKVEPIIWLEFYACPDQACAASTEKITIATDAWGSDPTLKTAFTILKSFKIE